jgi:hypothetical protein
VVFRVQKYFQFKTDLKTLITKENFFRCLTVEQKQWVLAENRFLRKAWGIKKYSKNFIKNVKNSKCGNKMFDGTVFYDILACPEY